MLTLPMHKAHPAWSFWLLWIFATIAAAVAFILVMGLIAAALNVMSSGSNSPSASNSLEPGFLWIGAALAVLSMAATGLAFGLAQWLVLRKYVIGMNWWVLATAAGYAVLSAGSVLPFQEPGWLQGAIVFLMVGIALGILQWLVLRPRFDSAIWWVVVSVGGWALAYMVTGLAAVSGLYVEPLDLLAALLVPTAVSGAGMAWLLQHKRKLQAAHT